MNVYFELNVVEEMEIRRILIRKTRPVKMAMKGFAFNFFIIKFNHHVTIYGMIYYLSFTIDGTMKDNEKIFKCKSPYMVI